ncbi:MAG: hypothetical protein PHP70_06925 [Gallionella sp.]|nr:hypothetical protein [Gallionella sp.]
MTSQLPVGMLFSHVYLSGGPLLRDKETFRRRLGVYCQENFSNGALGDYLRTETGLKIPDGYPQYNFENFFVSEAIGNVLSAITLIWRFCHLDRYAPDSVWKNWHDFVARVLKEENVGYRLDEKCGVHFFVDDSFERNRQSIIPALGHERYTGVLTAFEGAYSALDSESQDTKQAVRLIFESVEILAKLMHPKTERLDKKVIETIRDQAKVSYAGDKTACSVADKMFASFVDWMDGLHFYRHGQGVENHVAPPLDMAIFAISSGTNYLRWFLEIDAIYQPT